MIKNCRKCPNSFEITPYQFKAHDYECPDCRRIRRRLYSRTPEYRAKERNYLEEKRKDPEYREKRSKYDANYRRTSEKYINELYPKLLSKRRTEEVRTRNNKTQLIRRLSPESKLKRSAHSKVQRALINKELIKYPCEVCGTTEIIEAHHDDYSKPLDVRWLCKTHHMEFHRTVIL